MSSQKQASKYTTSGLSFYNPYSVLDAMWHDCPHPALLSPTVGFGFVDHFVTFSPDSWTTTVVEVGTGSSTIAMTDGEGGVVRINAAANENDGAQAQLIGEQFKLASTNRLWFDAYVKVTEEATQSDFAIGLATTTTTVIASAPNDYVLFVKDDGDTNIDFVCAKDGTETESAAVDTAVTTAYVLLGFKYDGSSLTPYINGVAGTAVSTNIPDNENLSPIFAYLNGAGTAQNDGFNVDFMRCVALY